MQMTLCPIQDTGLHSRMPADRQEDEMTRKLDTDYLVLKRCTKELLKSSNARMLKANLEFLMEKFVIHPDKEWQRDFWSKRK